MRSMRKREVVCGSAIEQEVQVPLGREMLLSRRSALVKPGPPRNTSCEAASTRDRLCARQQRARSPQSGEESGSD